MTVVTGNIPFAVEQLSGEPTHRDVPSILGLLKQARQQSESEPEIKQELTTLARPVVRGYESDTRTGLFLARHFVRTRGDSSITHIVGLAGVRMQPKSSEPKGAHIFEFVVKKDQMGDEEARGSLRIMKDEVRTQVARLMLNACIDWAADQEAEYIRPLHDETWPPDKDIMAAYSSFDETNSRGTFQPSAWNLPVLKDLKRVLPMFPDQRSSPE